MGRHSQEKKAQMENSLARFLLEWCEEGDGMEVKGSDLWSVYCIWHRVQNKLKRPSIYLDLQQLYRLLELAEFKKEVRAESTPLGREVKVVYWAGLRVIQDRFKVGLQSVEGGKSAVESSVTNANERSSAKAAQPIKPAPLAVEHSDSTHVLLNGTLYNWNLISVVRQIKPFKDSRTGKDMHFIVTFTNPEMRHLFLDKGTGERVQSEGHGRLRSTR